MSGSYVGNSNGGNGNNGTNGGNSSNGNANLPPPSTREIYTALPAEGWTAEQFALWYSGRVDRETEPAFWCRVHEVASVDDISHRVTQYVVPSPREIFNILRDSRNEGARDISGLQDLIAAFGNRVHSGNFEEFYLNINAVATWDPVCNGIFPLREMPTDEEIEHRIAHRRPGSTRYEGSNSLPRDVTPAGPIDAMEAAARQPLYSGELSEDEQFQRVFEMVHHAGTIDAIINVHQPQLRARGPGGASNRPHPTGVHDERVHRGVRVVFMRDHASNAYIRLEPFAPSTISVLGLDEPYAEQGDEVEVFLCETMSEELQTFPR